VWATKINKWAKWQGDDMSEDETRRRFETWAKAAMPWLYIVKTTSGGYRSAELNAAWNGFLEAQRQVIEGQGMT
jgi:hypothetical protein